MSEIGREATNYERISDLFVHAHESEGARNLIQAAEAMWPSMSTREPTAEDAEICRLTMLAALYAPGQAQVRLWKARALARFTSIGWKEGVGALLVGEAFSELARANDDYENGRTLDVLKPSSLALEILEEIEPFTKGPGTPYALGPGSPSTTVLERFFHEKRGFLLLLLGDFPAARASYERAFGSAQLNARGTVMALAEIRQGCSSKFPTLGGCHCSGRRVPVAA